MAIGSCTSCSPVLDAARLSTNPKADANGDGKVTSAELQTAALTDPKNDPASKLITPNPDDLKVDARNTTSTYIAQRSPGGISSGNILQLAESNNA